jgi:hypothetical protein
MKTNGSLPKRPLQVVTALLGSIPVATGIIGMMGVTGPFYAAENIPKNVLLDSDLRYFGGLWLGVGLALLWLLPRIDTLAGTAVFRLLWGMILIGGIGRLLSMFFVGMPPADIIGFTALEVLGAPLFVLWQSKIRKPY